MTCDFMKQTRGSPRVANQRHASRQRRDIAAASEDIPIAYAPRADPGRLPPIWYVVHEKHCRKEARRGVQGLKTKGSGVLWIQVWLKAIRRKLTPPKTSLPRIRVWKTS